MRRANRWIASRISSRLRISVLGRGRASKKTTMLAPGPTKQIDDQGKKSIPAENLYFASDMYAMMLPEDFPFRIS